MATRTLQIVLAGESASASRAFRKVEQDADRMGKRLDREGGRVRGFATVTSKGFGRVGVAAGGMAAAGVGAAALLAKSFVEGATSIDESLNKNRVLFGNFADNIDRFAASTAKNFGISRQAALEATGTFGNLFTALDVAPRAAGRMSISLTRLAADMASFNNASPEETLEAIRSGLVGETEPLRRFGVNLNDATLRAEALRMGLVKNTKEALEPQTKALAVNSLLFEQTKKAQGDFQRTSDGLANQQKILKAQFSDTSAELGGRLMPFALKAVSALNSLFDSSSAGGRVIERLKDAVQVASRWIRGAFSDALAFANKWIDKNRKELETARDAFRNLARAARYVFEEILLPVIRKVVERVIPILEGLRDTISGLVRFVTNVLTGKWGDAWDAAKDTVKAALRTIKAIIVGAADVLLTAALKVGGAIKDGIVAGLSGLGGAVKKGIIAGVNAGVRGAAASIGEDALNFLIPNPKGFAKRLGDGVGKTVETLIPAFGGGLMGARPELSPIAGIASRFGLGVSSGRRPGAITSSGRQSWHSTGEALDISGPPSGMMGFARFMSQRAGSLAELIYTPLGAWSNGSRYTPTGKLAADHYDHVHVAMDVGTPGQGDGIGKAVQAARSVGLTGDRLATMVAIAGAESGFNPRINAAGPEDSRGLWQINVGPGANTDMLRLGDLYNPMINAKAMKIILGRQGLGAWSVYTSGAYKDFLSRARAAIASGGRGGGAGGGGNRATGGGGFGTVRGSGNVASGIGDTRPTSDGPLGYEGQLAGNAIGRARAENRDSLSGLIKALVGERTIKKRRLRLINKVLRGRIGKARRTRLLQEKAQLIGEIGDLTDTIKEYKADRDVGGATTISRAEELEAGVDTNAPPPLEPPEPPEPPPDDSAAIAELTAAITRMTQLNEWMVRTQGPTLVGAVLAAVNGGIGGPVGLGFQGIRSAPGSVAGL